MMRSRGPNLRAITLLFVWVLCRCLVSATAAETDDLDFFERKVRPVLVEHCYECHSADAKSLKGGLRVDSRATLLTGGDTRPAIVPNKAADSLLVEAIRYGNQALQMPPKHRLSEAVIADLEFWINRGAVFPGSESPVAERKPDSAAAPSSHWAFKPISDHQPPDADKSIPHPVDCFIRAKLAEQGLQPASPADRRTLVRRVYFDLIGLPPTPAEVDAFLSDIAPDAYERLIERLLASPRYGERWGRWWLDVARYADTNGQDENKVMANAWRYRDWVIAAFNSDKPFDQFTVEQIAGDLLPTNSVPEEIQFDRWTATGLLVMGPKMLAEQDKPKLVMDIVDEQIDIVSRAFLGLTVGCARCHDHKFDPVSARDYYALAGIFKSTRTMENLDFVSKFNERKIATREHLAALEAYGKALAGATNRIDSAIKGANASLAQKRHEQLGSLLLAAIRNDSVRSADSIDSDASLSEPLKRLRQLLAQDSGTNSPARLLRDAASSPERLTAFLRDAETNRFVPDGLAYTSGKIGDAFLATGSNELTIPHEPALEPSSLSVEAWVRVAQFPEGGDTRRWLVNKNGNEWVEGHYALMIDGDRAGAYLNIGGGRENVFAVWSAEHSLKTGKWHHLAFSYDGGLLRLFVDGKPAGEKAVNRPRVAGGSPVVLARRQDGYNRFKGVLDEVRIFNRALTSEEVRSHFEHPDQPVTDGVVARRNFNDLTDSERATVARTETYEAIFGADGVLALPKDPRPLYPSATRDEIAWLERERDELKSSAPPPIAYALAVAEDKPVDLPVHIRGSHLNIAKDPVPRGFIQVVQKDAPKPLPANQSGRLELARWLTSAENPLPARVIVNRIWQAHFGEGLVRTPDNFGVRGELPTHPELLDWLAREFIRSGWSVKAMHRLILSSATYRQSANATSVSTDPENRLLAHFPRVRLEAEMVRDALLAVSGKLDQTTGGSLVKWGNNDYVPDDESSAKSSRRSVYLPVVRDKVYDVFTIFDFANPSVGQSKRFPTVVSHQALFFLNSPLVKDCASTLARTLRNTPCKDDAERIQLAYQSVLGRPPSTAETARVTEFLKTVGNEAKEGRTPEGWTAFCQMLFASNEFLYRD